ncbi:MAG: MFS transporter [Firmicutes bacterium]|nr:MFS transporter [Bacillota bacterium]
MTEIEKKRGFHYGYLIVACCCIFSATSVSLAFGCAGVFYTPVSEAIGVSRGVFVISFTCMSLTAGIGVKIMTPFVEKYSLKLAVTALLLLQSGCYFAQAQFTDVWMFYITGALLGVVVSLTQSIVATVAITRWFKTNTSFFIGFSSSMAGVSGIIINPIAGKVMELYGWEVAYMMYGAIILLLAIPFAVFVFKDFPEDKGLEPYSGKNRNFEEENDRSNRQNEISIEYRDAVRSKAFFAVTGAISCFVCTCCFVPYVASYASSLGMSITFAASLAGAAQIGSLIGKNTIGFAADRNPIFLVTLGPFVPLIGLIILLVSGGRSVPLLCIGIVLVGSIYAASTVGSPLVVIEVFGMKNFMKIYGSICVFTSLAGAAVSPLMGMIVDLCGGSFNVILAISAAMCAASIVLGLYAFKEGKKMKKILMKAEYSELSEKIFERV